MTDYKNCYNGDGSRLVGNVEKVISPQSVGEICSAIKNSGNDIVPRGFGISLVGGCVPNNSIVINMLKMNKVTNLDIEKKMVVVEAGVNIKELNEKLKARGFEFPIFSSDSELRSIGGMIALNHVGDRSMKYGFVKNWIEGIEIVNGRGEIMKIGKADVMDVCGMEGITGIIVSAKLKLIPIIKRSISLFQSEDIEEVLSIAKRLKLENSVASIQFFSKEVSRILKFPEKYHLIIEFDNEDGKIKGLEYDKIMKLKNKVVDKLYEQGYYNYEDPRLFFDKIEEFSIFLEKNDIPYFGDLGLGIIYPFFRDDDKEKKKEVFNFLQKIKVKFIVQGYGIKRKKLIDGSEEKVFLRVKKRYDPFGRLNRGKIIEWINNPSTGIKENTDREIKDIALKKVKSNRGEQFSADKIVEEIKSPAKEIENFIKSVEIESKIKEKFKEEAFDKALDFNEDKIILKNSVKEKIVPRKNEEIDYNFIQNIMTNKLNKETKKVNFDRAVMEDNLERDFDNNDLNKVEESNNEDKVKKKDEADLIKDIMTNRFGFSLKKEDEKNEFGK